LDMAGSREKWAADDERKATAYDGTAVKF
jgi:hypothetical protein